MQYEKDMQPILVVPAIPHDGGIMLLMKNNKIEIGSEFADVVWKILAQANGHNTIEDISKESGENMELTRMVIDDLVEMGAVKDSRELYAYFHEISHNPNIYHRNLSRQDIEAYTKSPRKPVKSGEIINFKKNTNTKLSELILKRRSCRGFSDEKLCKETIGNICFHAYSIHNHTVPSGGGLYPLKLYVLVEKDQIDLPAGYYEYDAENDWLVKFSERVDIEALKYCFNDESIAFGSSVQMIIAADLKRQAYKYSNRGYRLTLIEAGQVAQNISLYCEELGLSSCELGGVLDEPLMQELQFTEEISPLLAVALGKKSCDKPFDYLAYKDQIEANYVGEKKPVKEYGTYFWEKEGAFFGAYSVYGDKKQIAGATACSYPYAVTKAIIEGYERDRSSKIRTDFWGSADNITEKWINPNQLKPLTQEQCKLSGLTMFRNDLAISWTRGFYKNSGENILVPSDLIYYGYENDDHRICFGDSSGTAAHMDYEMAFKGALLELIERDALMRNWYERKPPVKISNDILPVHVKHRMEYWKAKGRNVYVLDMNSPYAATFQVVIVGEDYPCFVSGAATTIDNFEEAIQKALQEAEFSLLLDLQKKETVRISPKEVSSPQDHGNLYADKTYMNHISWLWSGEEKRKFDFKNNTIADLVTKLNPIVVDLSEEGADIKVLCVLSEHCIPISFGYGMDYYTHNALKDLNVDMENRKLPHYFA